MSRVLPAFTIKETTVSLDPRTAFQHRRELATHDSFQQWVIPALQPVEVIPRGRYKSPHVAMILGNPKKPYPRFSAQNHFPRWEPNSEELYSQLRDKVGKVLVRWEHLAFLLDLQSNGSPGVLMTSDSFATLCFMEGVDKKVFLIRAFWNNGPRHWYLRAWGFEERRDKGWSTQNRVLLPVGHPL